MNTITLQKIKSNGAKAISDEQPTYLIVNSQIKCICVPPAQYEMLIDALEELEDIRIIEERKGGETVELDEIFPKKKR